MEHLENLPSYRYPVENLIKELSEPPAPGACGAASWLCAIAAALVAKCARLTLGREGFEPVTEEMQRVIARATTLGEQCEELIDQDPTAMNRLTAAAALPQGSVDEQEIRRACVLSALKNAAQVPLLVAQNGVEVLGLAETVARYGAPGAGPEATLAVRTAAAAIDGALLASLAKLPNIDDEAFDAEVREKAGQLRAQARVIESELSEKVWNELG
jgi:formiminotetrahydrofolate cyclodeaminase